MAFHSYSGIWGLKSDGGRNILAPSIDFGVHSTEERPLESRRFRGTFLFKVFR
jgi:hypothetical protein